ncbi:MAG: IPT/TIG domain-containing protein [Treponema sp.]|nr:IPT/TIG domain-containing protein [Candidatus Treponema equifaecale]
MKLKETLSLIFRKYSSIRFFLLIALVLMALVILTFATVKAKKVPSIATVIPSVGSPGDTMVIRGTNFGSTRGSSCVEIGGSRITASSYIVWTDSLIKLVLPSNVQDGLIVVHTQAGRSKPGFFANETGIPVAVPKDAKTTSPTIASISPATGGYGTLITITGSNFGSIRGNSQVLFSAARDDADMAQQTAGDTTGEMDLQFIPASMTDFDYEYWSDNEIRVRIPDGAASGPLVIASDKGKSNTYGMEVTVSKENKFFHSRKTYVIQVNADIENINSKNSTSITLRMPKPVVSASQPMATLTECIPEPVLEDFRNTVVYKFELAKSNSANRKTRYQQSYIVSTYAVDTNLSSKLVRQYSEKERQIFKVFTQADNLVASENAEIIELAKKITGKEKNPFNKAKLIYTYILQNYKLKDKLRKSDYSPMDLLKNKDGDAYDFSIFYAALLRASGIPANPVSGILVDSELNAQNHWWNEIYFEGYGWVPADIALGFGMEYKSFKAVENSAEFYFGNLDGQHIAFSRGWNELKQTISDNSKIVYRPKTYALQSIWEESSEGNVNYSSLWNNPVVLGIY